MQSCSIEVLGGQPVRAQVDHALLSRYYTEFRGIARRALHSGGRVTIQPTDLVHEAALRLLASDGVAIRDEAHFLALGVRVIRMTLIDEIRRRSAGKRAADVVTLWDERDAAPLAIDIDAFDYLLDDFAEIDPEAAMVVQLRFYVGLTMAEIATEMAISESTALRRWRMARAWLFKELGTAA